LKRGLPSLGIPMIRTINGGKLKYPMFVRNICDSSTMRLSDRTREQEDIVCANPSSQLIYIFLKDKAMIEVKKKMHHITLFHGCAWLVLHKTKKFASVSITMLVMVHIRNTN
jgi:hypothetical protein